jgi:DNA transposase THAP9
LFFRKYLNLPHDSTLRTYVSSVNCGPGFLTDVMKMAEKNEAEDRICNLVIDAMALKKTIELDNHKKTHGYCDLGSITAYKPDEPASEALCIMAVSLSGKYRYPIANFMINKIGAVLQSQLLKTALSLCHEHNIPILGLTFDGASTNFSAMNLLGASLYESNYDDIKPFFEHPVTKEKVFCIPDAVHMLKLARNTLYHYDIQDGNDTISWKYIAQLHEVQLDLHFKFGNQLSKKHILIKKNIMKVKLAAQTMSSSVANSMEYFADENVPEFVESRATIKFLRAIDYLFDVLNSKNIHQTQAKAPITLENVDSIEEKCKEIFQYLFSLRIDNEPLHKHGRRTFLIGFATAIKSVLAISRIVLVKYPSFKFVLTFHFSQDFLELFFGLIRSRFGFNNNPTVLQFKYALRRILVKNFLRMNELSNVAPIDSCIGSVFSLKKKRHEDEDKSFRVEFESVVDSESDLDFKSHQNIIRALKTENLNGKWQHLADSIIFYLAGYLVRKISPKIFCDSCIYAICDLEKRPHNCARFLTFKDKGQLVFPTDSVFKLLKKQN